MNNNGRVSPIFRSMKEKILPVRFCAYCAAPLSGRADKKYCNLKCKNSYNNNRVLSHYYGKKILKSLDNNYSILSSLLRLGINSIPLQEIQELGFKTSSCSEVIMKSSSIRYRCYDIEYRFSSGRMFGIRFTSSAQAQP